MSKIRRTILFILALLPCAILILTVVQGVFSDQTLSLQTFSFGSVSFSETPDQITVSYSPDSIAESVLSGFFPGSLIVPSGTALYAFFHGYNMILSAFGFTQVSTVFMISSFYLIYYVALYYILFLVDFITAIPRLVERYFSL